MDKSIAVAKHRLLLIFIGVALVAVASLPFVLSASCVTRPQTLAEQKALESLRNMTRKDAALAEMRRVLRPGGRLVVLEFSRVWKPLAPAYDLYSFKVLPWLGERVAGDAAAYRYLAESIRMHPDQETLAGMMRATGLEQVEVFNLAAGVVAVHRGFRI